MIHLGWFPYLTLDHRAAQSYLNQKADRGFRLKRVWLGLVAQFEEVDKPPTYFVDLADPMHREPPEYQTLCADAGWEEVCLVRYMRIYQSRPGVRPVPIQTDGAVEYDRYRKTVLRRMLRNAVLLLAVPILPFLLFGMSLSDITMSLYRALGRSDCFALLALSLPLLLPLCLFYLIFLLCRLLHWRQRTALGEPIPTPHPTAALARGLLTLLIYGFTGLLGVCAGFDLARGSTTFLVGSSIGVFMGIPMARAVHRDKPGHRGRWYTNSYFYIILFAVVARLFSPGGLSMPLAVEAPPPPQAVREYESHSTWLAAYDTWIVITPLPDGSASLLRAERFTCRVPWLAQGVARSFLADTMAPVAGMDHTWRTPADLPERYADQLVLLREKGVLYCRGDWSTRSPALMDLAEGWLP